jgi:hypothetical protein
MPFESQDQPTRTESPKPSQGFKGNTCRAAEERCRTKGEQSADAAAVESLLILRYFE